MIKVKDGKLQAELLDNKGTLSNKIIEQYDYIELKNDFAEIVDILSTNMLVHAMYQEALKYEITEDLEFKIFIDENVKDYTLSYDLATDYSYISTTNTSVITLDRKAYDKSIELCTNLLKKVKASYDKLNEVEKVIIKSLEFDNPPETDEELRERLVEDFNRLTFFVLLLDDRVIGYSAIEIKERFTKKLNIDQFVILEKYRGMNYGRKLVDYTKEYGIKEKCDRIELNC